MQKISLNEVTLRTAGFLLLLLLLLLFGTGTCMDVTGIVEEAFREG
jgi:hypothetical protein